MLEQVGFELSFTGGEKRGQGTWGTQHRTELVGGWVAGVQPAWGLGQASSRGPRAAKGQPMEESGWLPEQGREEAPTQMPEPGLGEKGWGGGCWEWEGEM